MSRLKINEATQVTYLDSERILIATPISRFVIVDTFGAIKSTLEAIQEAEYSNNAITSIPGIPQETLEAVLRLLHSKRIIIECNENNGTFGESAQDLYLTWLGFISTRPASTLTCHIPAFGGISEYVKASLGDAGVNAVTEEAIQNSQLQIICTDAPSVHLHRELNRRAIDRNISTLHVDMDRGTISIGPLVIPQVTACYECAFHRIRATSRSASNEFDLNGLIHSQAQSRVVARLAAAMASTEALRFMVGAAYNLDVTEIYRHDSLTGKSSTNVILKIPRCPACGMNRNKKPLAPACSEINI